MKPSRWVGAEVSTKKLLQCSIRFQVSKNQLEKLTISTRYNPQTPFSVSGNNVKNSFGSSNYHIGSNSNAVTVVKVKQNHCGKLI